MLQRRRVEVRNHDRYAHPLRSPDRGRGRLSGSIGALNRSSCHLDRPFDRCVGAAFATATPRNLYNGAYLESSPFFWSSASSPWSAFVIERGLLLLPFGLAGVGFLASTLIAQRSLHEHVAGVADALEQGGRRGRAPSSSAHRGSRYRGTRRGGRCSCSDREPGGEFFRWRRRSGAVDAHRRAPWRSSLQGDQHGRQHDRPSHVPLPALSAGRPLAWTIWSTCRHRGSPPS